MKSKLHIARRLALVSAIAFTQTTRAAALTWDGSDTVTSGAQGGTGTWDANTTANWWNGAADVVWPNSGTDNDAIFAGTAGTVTIAGGGVTANDLLFSTTGYILSGAGTITLNGTTPTITTDTGISTTIGNNTATVLAGSAGFTKAGAGTLTLSGSAVNTFTGGLAVRSGTLALSFANLATSTNLIDSGNSLSMYNGGTLGVSGRTSAASAQTVNGTTVYTGNSTVTVNNLPGTSTTLTLGTVTQAEIGGVLSMALTNPSVTVPNTTTQIVKASNAVGYIGSWAVVGDSKGGTARWANVNGSGQVTGIGGTAQTANMANVTSSTTVYTIAGTNTLAADSTAFALQDNDNGSSSVTLGNFNITTNGLSQIRTGGTYTRSFLQGSGSGKIIVGASNELVAMGVNNLTIAVPIANGAGGNSHVTYAGGGTLLLSAVNTYSGQTTVNSGIVQVGTGGSINLSNGIKVNGGKFLQTNTATAISPTVTLQGGTIDGTGTINTVNVTNLAANKITNGNGTNTALTIGTLTLSGNASIDIRTAGSVGLIVSGTLTTTPANGTVVVNVTSAPAWITGTTYNLISYGTLSGSIGDFTKGTIPGLGARQSSSLVISGNNIALSIAGDSVRWTGAASGAWTTNAIGSPFNWKTLAGGVDTEFLALDDVVFDDTGANTTSIDISTANVSPNTIIFNNSSKNYTISSSGGFGISAGSLTKNGTGTTSLTTANTYAGTTTVNAGILQVSGGSAISNTGLVTLANTAGATFQIVGSETIGALSGGGATGGSVSIDAGQTLTTSSGTQTYAGSVSGSGTNTNAGATQTISGAVSIGGGVNVSSGVLTLSNSTNSYTGSTIVSPGGGLVVAANNALGGTTDGTTVTGAGAANGGVLGFSGGSNYSATEKITGSGVGNTAAFGVFAAAQRGFIQSVSGNNTFAGPVEITATGVSRIGVQDGAQLTLSGPITKSTGVTGVIVLFRGGLNNGDFITLTNNSNSWDGATQIFAGNTGTGAGLKLGIDNGLPVTTSVVAGGISSGSGNTFDLNGFDQTLSGLPGSNGTLRILNNGTSSSTLTLNNSTANSSNFTVQATMTTINDGTAQTLLVKDGSFSQTLHGTHTYTGSTTISAGTLALTATGTIDNTASVTIAAGATFDVSAKASYAVPTGKTFTLKLDGTATGTAGKIKAAALDITNATVVLDVVAPLDDAVYVLADYTAASLTGTQFLSVNSIPGYALNYAYNGGTQIALVQNSASGYTSWIGTFPAVGGLNQPGDDADSDGLKNLLEFVLNGNPTTSDSAILPKLVVTATDFEFTFNRRDDSLSPETTQTFQYSKDLTIWTDVIVPAASGPIGAATITVTDNGITDSVKVSIPKTEAAPGTKLFGRLRVVK